MQPTVDDMQAEGLMIYTHSCDDIPTACHSERSRRISVG